MTKRGRNILLILLALIVVIGATMFIRYEMSLVKEKTDSRPVVSVDVPHTRDLTVYTEQIGNIMPAEYAAVIPMMTGEILEVKAEVGDHVKKGDVLCIINYDGLKALQLQLDSSRIQLEDAKTNLERTQALFETGAVSQQTLEQLQSAVDAYQLAYDGAEEQLRIQTKYCNVTAPISGVIESKNVKVHDFASPQNPAFVIAAEGKATITFGITEASAGALQVGDPVTLTVGATDYEGKVTEIAGMVGSTGLRQCKADIAKGDDLVPGSRGKVTLLKERVAGALTVPMKAVFHAGNESFVYVLDGTKAVKATFTPGIFDGEYIEILDGLMPGDSVICTWNKELYNGAEVIVKE